MTEQRHSIDALHDAVSGRLSPAGRVTLDAHLAECPTCRRELAAMSWLAAQSAAAADAVAVPADLEASLRRALDTEDASRRQPTRGGRIDRRAWLAAGGAAAAAALVAVVVRLRDDTEPDLPAGTALPAAVAADYRAYAAGRLPLDVLTAEPARLDAHLRASSLGFEAEVFDFAMMAYALEGGGAHTLAGRPSALFAYRGAGNLRMICQMYPGVVAELPPPDRRRTSGGVTFLVYDRDDVTLVFWQDGPVVCVLAANGAPEAAIVLAIAKGVPG